ncbi:MAG: c-type cytochrome [Pseudomonadota bacterium]
MMSTDLLRAAPRTLVLGALALGLAACSDGSEEAIAQATDPAVAGTVAACAACHGAGGEGNEALGAPAIANLEQDYLERQLNLFRTGLRGFHEDDERGQQMRAIVAPMSEAQIREIAAAVGAFDPVELAPSANGEAADGKNYYTALCGACHGPDATGNPRLNAPSLVAVDGWYLVSQFEAFRKEWRGVDPADHFGRQMQYMTRALPEVSDTRAVAAYIETLR